jgi:osmotically-inducible protein OsmY
MRTYRKSNRMFTVAVAMAALALGTISAAADAQDSSGADASRRGADADVAAHVRDALQSNPTIDSRHIDVTVDHGDVHLKGFVQDSRTLLAAAQVASKAAGSRKIVNDLIIKQNVADAP